MRAKSLSQAELAQTILRQAFALAVRYDAMEHNPVMSVSKPAPPPRPEPRALTGEELARLRTAVAGMRINTWLADVFEVQFGTGARIGEVLALTVDDLDLENTKGPRVVIAATVVCPRGQKHFRQAHVKSGRLGRREVLVPQWVADVLAHRALLAGPSRLLFASRNDTLLDPHNVRESWRRIRDGVDLAWVTPHNLRKTAASLTEAMFGLETAAALLGHGNTAVTERHYIPNADAPAVDARAAFAGMEPSKFRHLRTVEEAS